MKSKIFYEYFAEEIDSHGDIVNINFADTLQDLPDAREEGYKIGLTYNAGNEVEGLTRRLWAYIENGILPGYFSNEDGQQTAIKTPTGRRQEVKQFYQQEYNFIL